MSRLTGQNVAVVESRADVKPLPVTMGHRKGHWLVNLGVKAILQPHDPEQPTPDRVCLLSCHMAMASLNLTELFILRRQ